MIAPVARYAGVWNIPVVTTRAQVHHFAHKTDYPTLTRMMGSDKMLRGAIHHILDSFSWNVASLIFYNHPQDSTRGNAKCYFIMSAIFQELGKKMFHHSFNDTTSYNEFKGLLREVAKKSRSQCSLLEPTQYF